MRKKYGPLFQIIVSLAAAGLIVLLYLQNAGFALAAQMADGLYQQGGLPSGNIFILEIDEKSIEELGPYQTWTRDYIAKAIELLNQDEGNAPAVIGVDILYTGETKTEADEVLVKASQAGNVVMGSLLNIETALQENEGSYQIAETVTLYEEPYEALRQVTQQGFVNGFADKDGVIRHGMLKMQLPDGMEIPSFSFAVYQRFAEKSNLPVIPKVPVSKEGYWYLPYQAYPGGYSNAFSISDFIQGEIDGSRFADSIVLIGPYAEGLMDSQKTAIDHVSPMYGVEIHANMIDAMINQDFKTEVSKPVMAVLIGLFVFCFCLFCQRRKLLHVIFTGLAVCAGYPVIAYFIYQRGLVLDVLYLPASCFLILVVTVVLHYIRVRLEKHLVEKTFKRYVAPEVVDKIMKTGMEQISLGGAAVDIACLFVDIRGFTTMSEMLTPEEVVEILNRYLNLTSSCIFKHHGTLDKFIGDATMAIFNAPLAQEDYLYEAVCTALDMVKGADALSSELQEKYGRSVTFGIGVHCGKAVVGNIGTDRRMDYTAIGDTVNTAARLETNAPAGTILISKAVYDRLKDRILAVSIGNLPLKGKKEELEVFRVEGLL